MTFRIIFVILSPNAGSVVFPHTLVGRRMRCRNRKSWVNKCERGNKRTGRDNGTFLDGKNNRRLIIRNIIFIYIIVFFCFSSSHDTYIRLVCAYWRPHIERKKSVNGKNQTETKDSGITKSFCYYSAATIQFFAFRLSREFCEILITTYIFHTNLLSSEHFFLHNANMCG